MMENQTFFIPINSPDKDGDITLDKSIEKIKEYIKFKGYDWTPERVLEEFEKYKNGEYVSHTARDVIKNCIEQCK